MAAVGAIGEEVFPPPPHAASETPRVTTESRDCRIRSQTRVIGSAADTIWKGYLAAVALSNAFNHAFNHAWTSRLGRFSTEE